MAQIRCIIGFEIQPAQSLSSVDTNGLNSDLTSLLFSLTYNPEKISKVTLDLRYVASQDKSLVAKGLDIVLLIRVEFDEGVNDAAANVLLERFRGTFSDLLSLHLHQYEFGLIPLSPERVKSFLSPFKISSVVEISRRITGTRPFGLTTFKGSSPMTRVIDMLLREEGQCFLSVSLEPHLLTRDQTHQLELFGYKNPVIPSRRDEDELLESVLNLQQITKSMQSVFKMKIRLASDKSISQYFVNLVGSEISGQRDFYYFKPPEDHILAEIESTASLEFTSALHKVVNLDVPAILLDLVYLFRPEEAVSAFRLPTQRISVAQEKAYKTYPAPVRFLPSEGLKLGTTNHPSYKGDLPVYIKPEDRARHIYIIGKTGTGKSYQILNMVQQDVGAAGVCVIDPHGDLVNSIFPYIPESRINDVYYFDPSDSEYATGFNFLETAPNSDEAEKDYIVQEVLSMLLRFVDYDLAMFGPIAQQWTRFGCMTLMDSGVLGTIVDVPRLFSDETFQKATIAKLTNPILKQWWRDEFKALSGSNRGDILGYFTSKFSPMVTAPQVRNVLGQSRSTIDLSRIMNDGKILLVNLSSGMIGRTNSHFLGSLLVSRLLWTALNRAKDPIATRRPFGLYVDEFQNFISDSFEQILSEARKYGLSLTIAHQHLDQLRSLGRISNRIERAVLGNVGTMISFRLGGDAAFMAQEFGNPVDALTLKNLANRYAVVTMQLDGVPSMPFTLKTVDWVPPTEEMLARGERIREKARRRGRRTEEVEAEIRARYGESGFSGERNLSLA